MSLDADAKAEAEAYVAANLKSASEVVAYANSLSRLQARVEAQTDAEV